MKLTLTLILLCVLGFFGPVLFVADIEGFYDTYAFSGRNTVERPYVVITSIFMHGGLVHLLSNIFILFFFGIAVEKEIGIAKTLAIFLLGALLGDVLSLFVYPFDSLSVGASAGIFALIGAGILVKPFDLSFYPFIMPIPLALLGLFYVIYNLYGLILGIVNPDPTDKISYIGHFGGMLVGLAYGFRIKGIKKGVRIILVSLFVLIALLMLINLLLS